MSRCVVIGSGAREHALAWALAKSADVVVTPGNDGMAAHGLSCVGTPARELEADLFVIGPDQLVVDGLADELRAQGKTVFGPGAEGAQLEGSKAYLKDFLKAANVPTAAYGVFDDEARARAFLATMTPPYVIKTDGLAAGKGVLVTNDLAKAFLDVRAKLSGAAFGAAGARVIVEEGLDGEECSLFVICDGTSFVTLVPSQDFKRVGDNELGPNTGGMGSFAPMKLSGEQLDEISERIIKPTLAELTRRAIDYRGVLYAGLMVGPEGSKLLEYNVRFGDPETQVLAPLYKEKLYDLLLQASEGRLDAAPRAVSGAAVSVILASEGYPLRPTKGDVIRGLGGDGQLLERDENVILFHAGTRQRADGTFVTNGGRALSITGLGDSVAQARARAYGAAGLVTFRGMVQRSDIALVASRGDQ